MPLSVSSGRWSRLAIVRAFVTSRADRSEPAGVGSCVYSGRECHGLPGPAEVGIHRWDHSEASGQEGAAPRRLLRPPGIVRPTPTEQPRPTHGGFRGASFAEPASFATLSHQGSNAYDGRPLQTLNVNHRLMPVARSFLKGLREIKSTFGRWGYPSDNVGGVRDETVRAQGVCGRGPERSVADRLNVSNAFPVRIRTRHLRWERMDNA